VGNERFASQAHGFGNRFFRYDAAPFVDNSLPSHAAGNLLQDVGYQDPRAAEGWLAVADLWISYDISPERLLFYQGLLLCETVIF
jgi:hypothetical protein